MFLFPHHFGGVMPVTDEMLEDVPRTIHDGQEKFSDICKTCGHTRANHLVSDKGLNIFAVGECNFQTEIELLDPEGKPTGQYQFKKCECEKFNG